MEPMIEYLNTAADEQPELAPRQVWLLDDGDTAEYAAILGMEDDGRVAVAPMGNDPREAFGEAMLVDTVPTGTMVFQPEFVFTVPRWLFVTYAATIPADMLDAAADGDDSTPGVHHAAMSEREASWTARHEYRRRLVTFLRWHEML